MRNPIHRLVCALLLALISNHALAFDPAKSSRYPSLDLYRPNTDELTTWGPIKCAPGQSCEAGTLSVTPDGAPLGRALFKRFTDMAWLPDFKLPGDADWTNAFNRAIATQKEVYVPGSSDPYIVGTNGAKVVLKNGTTIRGAGRGITTIKLADAANVDVLQTENAYALFGSTTQQNMVLRWKISDLTIDGNRLKQTVPPGAGRDSVNCMASFGAAWTIHSVIMKNCLGNGLRTEYVDGGDKQDDLTLDIYKLAIDTVGRNGWEYGGPHDGHVVMLEVIDAGQDADNTFNGVRTYGNGASKFINFHGWHRAATTNRVAYQFNSHGGSSFAISDFEGGRGQFYTSGSVRITGSQIYSHFGAPGTAMAVFAGGGSTLTGNAFFNDTAADCYALQIGTVGSAAGVISATESTFNSFVTRGPVNFVNDGGANRITGIGYAAPGGPTTVGGTISPLSTVDLSIQGQGLEVHQTSKRPWKDFPVALSSTAGSLGAWSGAARYEKIGNSIKISGYFTISNVGSATGAIKVQLPEAPRSAGSVSVVDDNSPVWGVFSGDGFIISAPSVSGKTYQFNTIYETY